MKLVLSMVGQVEKQIRIYTNAMVMTFLTFKFIVVSRLMLLSLKLYTMLTLRELTFFLTLN